MLLQKINLVRTKKNKIKIYYENKNKEKTREYGLNYYRILSKKKKRKKKSMEEIAITTFSSVDEKRKTHKRICIKITVKN